MTTNAKMYAVGTTFPVSDETMPKVSKTTVGVM